MNEIERKQKQAWQLREGGKQEEAAAIMRESKSESLGARVREAERLLEELQS